MKHKIVYKHHTDKKLSWLISNQVEGRIDEPKIRPATKYVYRRQTDILTDAGDVFRVILEAYLKQLADKNNEIVSKLISNGIQI